jgi:hypothetical protein
MENALRCKRGSSKSTASGESRERSRAVRMKSKSAEAVYKKKHELFVVD